MILSLSKSLFTVAVVSALASLSGCSAVDSMVQGDKIDYRSAGAARKTGLEVPPDLSQLTHDSRYLPVGGTVSAAAIQSGAAPAQAAPSIARVAVNNAGEARIERLGNQRWLATALTPEQLWPQLQAFWRDNGLTLTVDQPATGVMETDWAENRAKLPQDFIRSTIGRIFDAAYSTGELDKYRTRVERGPNGSTEVYITHRGMVEVYRGALKDSTGWEPRLSDPQLEAEILSRLLVRLGSKQEQATAAVVAATTAAAAAPARARILEGRPEAALQIDDNFDRAWRRVGLALDRRGFTVEDRDRSLGLYYVRYIDPALAGREEPGFLSRLFSSEKFEKAEPVRYRVAVKSDGAQSVVSMLNARGEPESGPTGQRIVALLIEELK